MNKKLLAIGFGLVAVLLLCSGVSIYPDYLWFENLGFSPVFWTMLLSKFGLGFIIWLFLILIISLNLYVARRLHSAGGSGLGFKAADLVSLGWYLRNGALQIEGEFSQVEGAAPAFPKVKVASNVKKHLIFLAGIIILLLAWSYYLKIYGLLHSTQGPAFGASYTDVHIKILAYKVVMIGSL
jgi:uncharacterized membrane protein (UPF0182 family)